MCEFEISCYDFNPFKGIGCFATPGPVRACVGCSNSSPLRSNHWFSVSTQDGIVALKKAHTRSAPSLSSLPKVALETAPMFAWLNTDRSRPWRMECLPLPFSTPLSFRRSVLRCSGLSMLRKFPISYVPHNTIQPCHSVRPPHHHIPTMII